MALLPQRHVNLCGLLLLVMCGWLNAAEIIQSPTDNRSFRALDLENGLKVLLISSPDADKAAASLEVSVGSGADPKPHQGLAHFLEHMLFLGTEKYPEAGAYQAFISQHGGRHNAFTAYDRTNYFFDVDQQHLEPALDRFAQFFISPLFSPEYVDRERHAVHSEYQSKLKEDGRRGYAVTRTAINPDHPLAKFSVGSLDTLTDHPGAPLQQALLDFYARHYTANRMSLVIQGPQPLERLEQLARDKFSAIKTGDSQPPLADEPLFAPGTLPAQLNVQSLRDIYQLSFTFPVDPIRPYWDKKPLQYLGAIIGHEGPQSLLTELKRRGWAQGLSAGTGFNYDDAAAFSVSIELTPQGLTHTDEIVALLFGTVARIRQDDLEKWRYEEERQISEIEFRFKEPSRELYDVLKLAGKLRHYPTEELLHGDYLFREFDPELIGRYLDKIRPENLLLTVTANSVPTDKVEPYYQVPYSLKAISKERLARWQQATSDERIQLPTKNPFLAQDFSLEPSDGIHQPKAIDTTAGFRLWYQQDDDFAVPRANFYVTFRTPAAYASARNKMLTALYVELVNDQLNSFLYPASVAGFRTSLYPHVRGFSLRLSGYSDRQERLLKPVLQTLATLKVNPARFDVIANQMRQELENEKQSTPYELAFDELRQRILIPSWTVDERLQALADISAEQVQQFIPQLLAKGNIEALAHGNISREEALRLAQVVRQQLLGSLTPTEVPPATVQLLPEGTQTQPLAVDHNDKAVILYLQGRDDSLGERARFSLINKLISAPFYTELRTEKQRGYIVFSSPYSLQDHAGIALVVQSPATPPQQLVADMESFLSRVESLVNDLDDTALEQLKQSLLVSILEREKKLNERTGRYWQELDREYLQFDSREQLAAALRQVTKQELVDTVKRLNERRLLVLAERAPDLLANPKPGVNGQ